MKQREIILMGNFDNLNKMINASRYNKYVGNNIKQRNQKKMVEQLQGQDSLPPHGNYWFHWHKSSRREDKDNVATAVKYFFDALQEVGVMLS